jgi:hypothetical protein
VSIVAHQALFGERQRGHGLIAASDGAPYTILKTLEGSTDLPAAPPTNIPWPPYYSGYSVQGWYVVSRTVADPGAARGGMVLTHALLLPPGAVGSVTHLRSLLDAIPATPVRMAHLEPVTLVLGERPAGSPEPEPPGLAALVHHLLRTTSNTSVAWVGEAGFEDVLAALWTNLWPEGRASLAFRLSFRPADLGAEPPAIVLVPEPAVPLYWRGMPLVRPGDSHRADGKAEAFLLGRDDAEPLRALLAEAGGELRSIGDLLILERASERLSRLESGGTEEVRALARLVGRLSPLPDRGGTLKTRILAELAAGAAAEGADGIAALENFDASPFPAGAAALRRAMDSWVEAAIVSADGSRPTAELVTRAMGTSVPGWSEPIADAVRSRVRAWRPRLPGVLWAWWSECPELVAQVSASLPPGAGAGEDLVRACPKAIPATTGAEVRSMAVTRGWTGLHAAAAAAAMQPQEAVDVHLQQDPAGGGLDGIRVLAHRLPSSELVSAAVRVGDPRLVEFAGEACASEPGLRSRLDVAKPNWRAVWLASIRPGEDPWTGIPDPKKVMAQVFDLVRADEAIDAALLAALADTPAADSASYPGRAELWARLPEPARHAVLGRTADGWLELFAHRPDAASELEPALHRRVVETARLERHLLSARYADVATVAALTDLLHLPESSFLTWLRALLQARVPLTRSASELLGDLVLRRRWKDVAELLAAHVVAGRSDLESAVVRCGALLGFFDKLKLAAGGFLRGTFGEDEWWIALTDIAADLYPRGPRENGLWSRAGGTPADLDDDGNGRERWRGALQWLRRGGGHSKITVGTLLREMLRDYPQNERVRLLYEWVKST